jgi:anti-anti-sigma regulatory factor
MTVLVLGAEADLVRQDEWKGAVATRINGCLIVTAGDDLGGEGLEEFSKVALAHLKQNHARHAVFDLSPVCLMDAEEFYGLVGLVQIFKLLGTDVLITGLRRGLILYLVSEGVDISGIRATSTLEQSIKVLGVAY